MNKNDFILKEFVKTTGNCKKVSSISKGKPFEAVENEFIKNFNDRNCRDRCDKDSSCTGYLLPRIQPNYSKMWCVTYTSVKLTGNGRKDYDCWMKGTRPVMNYTIGVDHFDVSLIICQT